MARTTKAGLPDLGTALGSAVDLAFPAMAQHHRRVAHIAASIARALGLSPGLRHELVMAALLHDVGTLVDWSRPGRDVDAVPGVDAQARAGYLLLRKYRPLAVVAQMVRYHRLPWVHGAGRRWRGEYVPFRSHLLHLADWVDAFVDRRRPLQEQMGAILTEAHSRAGERFAPEAVAALSVLAVDETFWLGLEPPALESMVAESVNELLLESEPGGLRDAAELLAWIVGFRRCGYRPLVQQAQLSMPS